MFNRQRRPLIVPIFIPNQGCPHRCIFCHQESITGQSCHPLKPAAIRATIETALRSPRFKAGQRAEIAFYGGTFTRLPIGTMKAYLEAVKPFLDRGLFHAIRISTRPDALDPERLDLLSRFGVSTVELGTQSMNDEVLDLSKRGHKAGDTVEAVYLLRGHGFRVGIQLMPGLPGDSEAGFLDTVDQVIALDPDMVRLYPAVVIEGTEMATLYREGRYRPLELQDAVRICEESCIRLETHGIPVIRIGLMSSPTLLEEGRILAGPWHTAFGFLVRAGIHRRKITDCLPGKASGERIMLRCPPREIPLVRGYRNQGLAWIEESTGATVVGVIPDESVPQEKITVDFLPFGWKSVPVKS